jgi:hypothetical protein
VLLKPSGAVLQLRPRRQQLSVAVVAVASSSLLQSVAVLQLRPRRPQLSERPLCRLSLLFRFLLLRLQARDAKLPLPY